MKSKFTTATIINAHGDVPPKVVSEMRDIWRDHELGNDYCYYSWDEEMSENYPAIEKFIADNEIEGDILLHFWW